MKPASRLHLVVSFFVGAATYAFRYSYEQPNPVAPAVGLGFFFVAAAVIALVLKIAREDAL